MGHRDRGIDLHVCQNLSSASNREHQSASILETNRRSHRRHYNCDFCYRFIHHALHGNERTSAGIDLHRMWQYIHCFVLVLGNGKNRKAKSNFYCRYLKSKIDPITMSHIINALLRKAENLLSRTRIRLFKTAYVNFRTLPFKQAVKWPIFIYGRVKLYNLSGQIEIRDSSIAFL